MHKHALFMNEQGPRFYQMGFKQFCNQQR